MVDDCNNGLRVGQTVNVVTEGRITWCCRIRAARVTWLLLRANASDAAQLMPVFARLVRRQMFQMAETITQTGRAQ